MSTLNVEPLSVHSVRSQTEAAARDVQTQQPLSVYGFLTTSSFTSKEYIGKQTQSKGTPCGNKGKAKQTNGKSNKATQIQAGEAMQVDNT